MPTSRIDSIDQNTTEKTPPNKETELTEIHNSLTNSFEEQLLKKTLSEIMNLLGIPNSYDDRYELIYQLYNAGIVIFEPTLNFFEASRPSLAEEKEKIHMRALLAKMKNSKGQLSEIVIFLRMENCLPKIFQNGSSNYIEIKNKNRYSLKTLPKLNFLIPLSILHKRKLQIF